MNNVCSIHGSTTPPEAQARRSTVECQSAAPAVATTAYSPCDCRSVSRSRDPNGKQDVRLLEAGKLTESEGDFKEDRALMRQIV